MVPSPLRGRTVIVTRAREQASGLAERLEELGASVVELPVITIADPSDGGAALRAAAARVESKDWIIFTSVNAVDRFLPLLDDRARLDRVKVAAVGSATARALHRWGVSVDLVPARFVGEALLEVFPPPHGRRRVLLPRAADARQVLPQGLRAAGWEVEEVDAYRTERLGVPPPALAALEQADAVTFTSSSTVTGFLEAVGGESVPPVVACIGPVTAETARRHGVAVTVEAQVHTIEGLVDALVAVMVPSAPS